MNNRTKMKKYDRKTIIQQDSTQDEIFWKRVIFLKVKIIKDMQFRVVLFLITSNNLC